MGYGMIQQSENFGEKIALNVFGRIEITTGKKHQWTERGDWYPSLLSREKLWNWFAGWIFLCKLHQRSIGVSRSQYREIYVESRAIPAMP